MSTINNFLAGRWSSATNKKSMTLYQDGRQVGKIQSTEGSHEQDQMIAWSLCHLLNSQKQPELPDDFSLSLEMTKSTSEVEALQAKLDEVTKQRNTLVELMWADDQQRPGHSTRGDFAEFIQANAGFVPNLEAGEAAPGNADLRQPNDHGAASPLQAAIPSDDGGVG